MPAHSPSLCDEQPLLDGDDAPRGACQQHGSCFQRLAFFTAGMLSNPGHSPTTRQPPPNRHPPLRVAPSVVWDAFFLYVVINLGGLSLSVSLPELLLLTPFKAMACDALGQPLMMCDHCGAATLTALLASSVLAGVVSVVLCGSCRCVVVAQWLLSLLELCFSATAVAVAGHVLTIEGVGVCPTTAVSLACSVIELAEAMPFLGVWTALLAVRCHRDTPGLPLVNLYVMLPPRWLERWLCMPHMLRASTLYQPCRCDGRVCMGCTLEGEDEGGAEREPSRTELSTFGFAVRHASNNARS